MNKLNEREIKKRLVDLLCRFDKICRENNLSYSLGYGTLLGAVRHQGFIPWDDDIDVIMPQHDYIKFLNLECFKNQKIDSNCVLFEIDNSSTQDYAYVYPFAKLMDGTTFIKAEAFREVGGIWIDIFPITGIPARKKDAKRLFNKLGSYHLKLAAAHRYRDVKKCSLIDVIKQIRCNYYFLRSTSIVNKMKDIVFSYPYNLSSNVANALWGYGIKEIMPSKIFEEYIELQFEDKKFFAIKEYEFFLETIYGNWKELPPIENRVAHHYYEAYEK